MNVFIYVGHLIEVEKKLLDSNCHAQKPDEEFLESLAGVVGSKWSSLASLLSLTSDEVQEVMKEEEDEEGLPPIDRALLILKKWISKEGSTYGQLYHSLKAISLFELCK